MTGDATLIAQNLHRVYDGRDGRVDAVSDVSLRVPAGSTVAVLGPNGAGKTTTVRMCSTLLTPTRGDIRIRGVDAVARPAEARRHLGLVLGGDRGFYQRASAAENLRYFASLAMVPRRQRRRRIDHLLGEVGLSAHGAKRVEEYSRGMRQRLHLARALLADPPLLLLDEPTIGLDPEAALEARQLIARLNAAGRSILLTTHYLHEAEALADEVIVIMEGRIVARGTVSDIARAGGAGDVTGLRLASASEGLLARLRDLGGVLDVRAEETHGTRALTVTWYPGRADPAALARAADAPLATLVTRPATLEEAYLALVARRRAADRIAV
ncbi:MAG TPA: ABC transporter ATP-binding protein [Stackebrandtia sp.]|jgi:ABC-2 type transport system ATP-binding protein|uniref:ABC transporter ATP-binding protein n=1 Tax=Stackebrandtia sp. TaxID=2023065 RepID=UPI002D300389|nr:ABC transporter ATP-binding protein [Stackebrandtia sp.]HZE40869.1 ABC transporter ATP-binding protein [Stackebrandtia sp.]